MKIGRWLVVNNRWSVVYSQWFAILLFLFLLTSCSSNRVMINSYSIDVEIADSPAEYQKGLMFREPLKANEGMIFVFTNEEKRSFWMKNVFFPIDIIFINSEKKVVDIKSSFYPCTKDPCEIYTSKPAKYVLEVPRGFVEKHEVNVGDLVEFKY